MRIESDDAGPYQKLKIEGRLDAFGAKQFSAVAGAFLLDAKPLLIDMAGVPYLSSAGVRVLIALRHRLGDAPIGLLRVADYCRDVLEISGLSNEFRQYESLDAALLDLGLQRADAIVSPTGIIQRDIGAFRFLPGSSAPTALRVLGDINHVLASTITRAQVGSKKFSEAEYSLGLGGLGAEIDDYYPIMGEMITVGGTMVWLPTDGNDTADYLVPAKTSAEVLMRTGFNASLPGDFNEYVVFESVEAKGATMTELYRELFRLARERRPDFRGLLGIGARCQMGEVYGAGARKSPVIENQPANGKPINDPANYAEWFELDAEPRLRGVTGLLAGVGADLTRPLDFYDPAMLHRVFYLNPGNVESGTERLHNHGVFFDEYPLGDDPTDLEAEIQAVVTQGNFVDMRHLLDRSTITRAIIGLSYIQRVEADEEA